MKIRRYTWKRNEESAEWNNEAFRTIYECVDDAKASGIKSGETILIGEAFPYMPSVDASEVLKNLEQTTYDLEVGPNLFFVKEIKKWMIA